MIATIELDEKTAQIYLDALEELSLSPSCDDNKLERIEELRDEIETKFAGKL